MVATRSSLPERWGQEQESTTTNSSSPPPARTNSKSGLVSLMKSTTRRQGPLEEFWTLVTQQLSAPISKGSITTSALIDPLKEPGMRRSYSSIDMSTRYTEEVILHKHSAEMSLTMTTRWSLVWHFRDQDEALQTQSWDLSSLPFNFENMVAWQEGGDHTCSGCQDANEKGYIFCFLAYAGDFLSQRCGLVDVQWRRTASRGQCQWSQRRRHGGFDLVLRLPYMWSERRRR